jgi:hypothetical protein
MRYGLKGGQVSSAEGFERFNKPFDKLIATLGRGNVL